MATAAATHKALHAALRNGPMSRVPLGHMISLLRTTGKLGLNDVQRQSLDEALPLIEGGEGTAEEIKAAVDQVQALIPHIK